MIIWINGTFGSGKTTIAHELDRRLEKSIIYRSVTGSKTLHIKNTKEIKNCKWGINCQ